MNIPAIRYSLLAFLLSTLAQGRSVAQEPSFSFEEEFALALDRAAILEQLIPGTEPHFFYSCLHHQGLGELDRVEEILQSWGEQVSGETAKMVEIRNRQALLRYSDDAAASRSYLQDALRLQFRHTSADDEQVVNLPSALDAETISLGSLTQRALKLHPDSLGGFRTTALSRLATQQLTNAQLIEFLNRLQSPDVSNLPALVVRELERKGSRGFGAFGIHGKLSLDQLEECARMRPSLLESGAFIESMLLRLRPTEDIDLSTNAEAMGAYLDRLQAFVDRLPPAQNSLKAHILYNRLRHDLATGQPDRERLVAYLRLPRQGKYLSRNMRRQRGGGQAQASLDQDFPTGLSSIGGTDEALVRRYLATFLVEDTSFESFVQYIDRDWLEALFAETKLLAGIGDRSNWYALLDDPARYEALEDRVDIDFASTQPHYYAPDASVELQLAIKNVDRLLIKVFDIDAYNYYRLMDREIGADIELDGLVANIERTIEFDSPPILRVNRTIEFPELSSAGTYVIELVGNGKTSRAVIRKGRLYFTQRRSSAGHAFRVFDEAGQMVTDATIWMGGREYSPKGSGEIFVPFTNKPATRSVVLRHGERASLGKFDHLAESVELGIGAYVDRETLLAGSTARILVRPSLTISGSPAALKLLEEPVLTVSARMASGVVSTQEYEGVTLTSAGELVQEITVPADLMELSVSLRGTVKSMSTAEELSLSASAAPLRLNGIHSTEATEAALLTRLASGYAIDVLGKNGEPRQGRAVHVGLTFENFTDDLTVSLKTDSQGRVMLGSLDGVSMITLNSPGTTNRWALTGDRRSYPRELHGVAGEDLSLAVSREQAVHERTSVGLLELRGGAVYRDAFDQISVESGFLKLQGLEPGDYQLLLKKESLVIPVRVTAGEAAGGWAHGQDRRLEMRRSGDLQVVKAEVEGEDLVIQLSNHAPGTRVHVMTTRYVPPYDALQRLGGPGVPILGAERIRHARSEFQAGRNISDEYRYVLDRRFAQKYPGNMLERPGLLLNPWSEEVTITEDQADDEEGEAFNGAVGMGGGAGGRYGGRAGRASDPGFFPDLEFLPRTSSVLPNLRADENGVVRIPVEYLGDGHQVHVIAVDFDDALYTTVLREELPLEPRSRVLANALDATKSFMEIRQIEFLDAGATTGVDSSSEGEFEIYDDLSSVFQLFLSLSGDQGVADFSFLTRWSGLDASSKLALYSEYACHELNLFLHAKDPEFFSSIVRPYLTNKIEKTFVDEWLLGMDLAGYLDPWAFERLNIVERILLARRMDGTQQAMSRHASDLQELLPVDSDAQQALFNSSLGALSLARGRKELGLGVMSKSADARGPAAPGPATPGERLRELGYVSEAEALDQSQSDDFFLGESLMRKDFKARSQLYFLFTDPAATERFVETHYWKRRVQDNTYDLVPVNPFWIDFAAHREGSPFVSTNLAHAANSLNEVLLALAVLDVPFEASEHKTSTAAEVRQLEAGSPLLIVRKEIEEVESSDSAGPVLISQSYFQLDRPFYFDGNRQLDAFIQDEFVIGVAYGCKYVVTNPTSSPRDFEIFVQIPEGSIPVRNSSEVLSFAIRLEPYQTRNFDYAFYFPEPGAKKHYPVQVSEEGKVVAAADASTLKVVAKPTVVDTNSWEYISQRADLDAVLDYLGKSNLGRLDLSRIAWRMRDQFAFNSIIEHLRDRHVYSNVLWSYGFFHGDSQAMGEYLRHEEGFLSACGPVLVSPLITLDPVERRVYEHADYEPLINGRAHAFGARREILNVSLAAQYSELMRILCYTPELSSSDWMSVTYYLLLQDRVHEALQAFDRVDAADLDSRIQYDYMRAYLDFFLEEIDRAREIAMQYREHPVERWRSRFQNVLNHIDEAAGGDVVMSDPEDRLQRQTALSAEEPALELNVEARRIEIRHERLSTCEIRYYLMDVEFLFSSRPFGSQALDSFAFVKPRETQSLTLPEDGSPVALDLPASLSNSNLVVEVSGGGITRRQASYASDLSVQFYEGQGQLQVRGAGDGQPKSKVYVKVFALTGDGSTRFHKDGYTDLRGRFDYVSLSGNQAGQPQAFSVLVLSDEEGAVVREVQPPQR